MFEIHKNYFYDDIFQAKQYLNLVEIMQFSRTFQVCKLKICSETDATHSNNYCITHFNWCHHSKAAPEQKVSKFCVNCIIPLQVLPAIVYISAVGYEQSLCNSSESRDQMPVFATHVRKVIGSYGNIDKYFNFRLFLNYQTIETYFSVIIIICEISSRQKIYFYNNTKMYLPIKENIT